MIAGDVDRRLTRLHRPGDRMPRTVDEPVRRQDQLGAVASRDRAARGGIDGLRGITRREAPLEVRCRRAERELEHVDDVGVARLGEAQRVRHAVGERQRHAPHGVGLGAGRARQVGDRDAGDGTVGVGNASRHLGSRGRDARAGVRARSATRANATVALLAPAAIDDLVAAARLRGGERRRLVLLRLDRARDARAVLRGPRGEHDLADVVAGLPLDGDLHPLLRGLRLRTRRRAGGVEPQMAARKHQLGGRLCGIRDQVAACRHDPPRVGAELRLRVFGAGGAGGQEDDQGEKEAVGVHARSHATLRAGEMSMTSRAAHRWALRTLGALGLQIEHGALGARRHRARHAHRRRRLGRQAVDVVVVVRGVVVEGHQVLRAAPGRRTRARARARCGPSRRAPGTRRGCTARRARADRRRGRARSPRSSRRAAGSAARRAPARDRRGRSAWRRRAAIR